MTKLVMRPNTMRCWFDIEIKIRYACKVESLKRCMRSGSATRRQFKSQIQIKVKLPITWLLIYIDVRYFISEERLGEFNRV